MTSSEMTVVELIGLLPACDRDVPGRQAMNPSFPGSTEHRAAGR
ncbi:hypothetical protein ACWD4G_06670 [Streptomyces sp. NPDC002643]